jgi:hypothetical protein
MSLKRRSRWLLLFAFLPSHCVPKLALLDCALIQGGKSMYMTRLAAAVFVFGAMLGISLSAFAGDEKASDFVVCKSAKSVRTLSITGDQNNSGASTCKVTYTKGGVPETVGEHTTKSSCKSILAHVQSTLENSKWNCKSVGAATVTTSSAVQ